MQNLDPEQTRNMLSQMSKEDLEEISKKTGMNLTPEMLQQVIGMFKNMNNDEFTNLIKNPLQANQNSNSPQTNPSQTSSQNKPVVPSTTLFPEIVLSKKQGNEKFKNEDWDMAITHYLEMIGNQFFLQKKAIIQIEDEKETQLNEQQKIEIKQLEIDCRNNLATVKSKINDYHSMIIHSEAVLQLDPKNIKALFKLGQGYHGMKKYEKALEKLKLAHEASPDDQTIQKSYQQCQKDFEEQKLSGIKEEEPNYNMKAFNQKMGMGDLFDN